MNKYALIIGLILIFISSCSVKKSLQEGETKNITQFENFDWLLGDWQRLGEEKGKETFEKWEKLSSSAYTGIGFTMQKGDTIKQEKINLVKINQRWVLLVQPKEEPEAIQFNMTSYNDKEFICENKELDFPKMIKYWKEGANLKALVAGDEFEIAFEFERR